MSEAYLIFVAQKWEHKLLQNEGVGDYYTFVAQKWEHRLENEG